MSSNQLQPIVRAAGEGQTHHALGVTLTFKTVGTDSGGQWLTMEYIAPPQFSGPPPHVHKVTTEIFYILEGTLTMQVNDQTVHLGAGGMAYVPPGTVHTFANQTDAPVKYLGIVSPSGLENYFAEMVELIKNEPQWPPKDMGPIIALMAKYDTFAPTAG